MIIPNRKSLFVAQLIDSWVQQIGTLLTCLPPKGSSLYSALENRTSQSIKLRELDNLSIFEAIDAIAELPILSPGLEFDSEDVAHRRIAVLKKRYRDISTYLKLWILERRQFFHEVDNFQDRKLVTPEFPSVIGNSPFALQAFARHDLALATCSESSKLREIFGRNGLVLWVISEFSMSRLELRFKGITSDPIILGKLVLHDLNVNALSNYRDNKVETIPIEELSEWRQELHPTETLCQVYLDSEAARIAKHNRDFDLNHWQRYLNILTTINELFKNIKSYQSVHRISPTEIFTTGKHKKFPIDSIPMDLPPKRRSKRTGRDVRKLNNRR